ncbi:MAG TPA: 2-oxo-4-hydroxy-4-carboxy-5-ureidoimidazoline decarboxylase [Xanthobacteraceae bacterium]|nr:2-oxo-4-hydroxy-4-carboxy-5-ureidoimidazoline decarboxylase [Xanthobacteraceae bacterium]
MNKLTLDALNKASAEQFVAALGGIFEHSPWVAERVAAKRPFETVLGLLEAMTGAVNEAARDEKATLLRAHPDLAGKAARAGTLTKDSAAEQGSAGLDQLSEREYDAFQRLNTDYRNKHEIPFIICVRRHTKSSLLKQFERRIDNKPEHEFETALGEVFRIAALRLDQKIEQADLGLNGRLSTHVLDNHGGQPAAGMALTLKELADHDAPRLLVSTQTNADGRTGEPLISGRPVPAGHYEILFSVADYYKAKRVPLAEPPFLDLVPIRFCVAEPEGHYHVPLLVTPWSYATYRGS